MWHIHSPRFSRRLHPPDVCITQVSSKNATSMDGCPKCNTSTTDHTRLTDFNNTLELGDDNWLYMSVIYLPLPSSQGDA